MPAAALVLLLWLPARAAETPADGAPSLVGENPAPRQRPARSMIDLIGLAVAQGIDENINPDVAQLLGLRRDLRTRRLAYQGAQTPDHLDRAFKIAYRQDPHGEVHPLCVLLEVTRVSLRDSMKYIQRCVLKLSVDGKLEGAAFEEGTFGKIERRAVPLEKVQKLYKDEVSFWRFTSPTLEAAR